MTAPTSTAGRRRRLPVFIPVLIATVALFAVCVLFAPATVAGLSLQAMIPFAAILAIAAAGQTLVVQQRGIDLSVGGIISLAAVGVPALQARFDIPTVPGVLLVLVFCALVGAANGVLIARLSITPLVATLAMNALLVGVVALLTGGSTVTASDTQVSWSTTKILGQPSLVWLAVIFVAVLAFVMAKTPSGRRFVLAGANPAAAKVSAVAVNRHLLMAYVAGAVSYAIAGILLGGYLVNPGSSVGTPYLLTVIATVIVGGTSLNGGRGTIVGSAIAAVFLSQLVQTVLTLGAPSSIQGLIQALAIAVAAVGLGLSQRVRRTKPKPQPAAIAPVVGPEISGADRPVSDKTADRR